MYEVIKAGGFVNGGLNFDAKARRQSNTFEDILLSYIAGMDAFALGLIKAYQIIEDGRIDKFIEKRYESYCSGIGKRIVEGKETLESLSEYAKDLKDVIPLSGRQEYLETVFNQILFNGKN
jgi:xylose isomerase